jgi:class 3 adenylate cyclase
MGESLTQMDEMAESSVKPSWRRRISAMSPAAAHIRRHLATVLAADAVGFTQLMRENAQAAVTGLLECRAILAEVIEAFNGTIVGTPGDFLLALMPSGLEAVEASVEIQRRLAARNEMVEDIMRISYRIGIGIGDVYERGSDVLGDAVNVASRTARCRRSHHRQRHGHRPPAGRGPDR